MVRGDFAGYLFSAAKGELKPELVSFNEGWSICVILASAGYPASSRNGDVIAGLDSVNGSRVFHCGTRRGDSGFETNGGRVLAVVAQGDTREAAREKAYQSAGGIIFDGQQRRSDIGRMHFE
ncbi:phosphoribosylglycinamide synthetase C domain-containing protein [Verrucomicrobium spinosum]|nr:phosphoribosylglycinamide synthetase C domain-containing protein [Verrucomicrobium spinosum]